MADPFVIDISGPIDAAMTRHVFTRLYEGRGATEMEIRINSHGGCYHEAVACYLGLRDHSASKQAVIRDDCHSAAALIALACDRRRMGPTSRFSFHLCASSEDASGRWTAQRHRAAAERLAEADAEMVAMMANRTTATVGAILAEALTEEPAEHDWLLRHGFIHEVVQP